MAKDRILRFEEALAVVQRHAQGWSHAPLVETVELVSAGGRVLAREVLADRDQPSFDRATRDGFAVRAGDVAEDATADAAGRLRVVGSLRAGETWRGSPLGEGEAIEIMTGAGLPDGADAVVMVEHSSVDDGWLRVTRALSSGENVVPRAAEAMAGAVVLSQGCMVKAAEIAVAASCGRSQLEVFAKPRVVVFSTGDELVELDEPVRDGQIRNSNSYALAALVETAGGVAERLATARDCVEELRARVMEGREADMVLLSGGVSMGKYDLVETVLEEFGAEFFFTGALIQPGRPVVFGRLPKRAGLSSGGWTYFFGLPGNPVSVQVCFHLFVAPMLRALCGRAELAPQFVEARLAEAVKGGARVTRFLPARVEGNWDGVRVRVVGWQGSGDVVANARGNGYVVLPAEVEAFEAGETVRVLLR
ncbi:MAG: gephyrin-like molybdotransferase Glp [Acidobacteriaceae bacterium]